MNDLSRRYTHLDISLDLLVGFFVVVWGFLWFFVCFCFLLLFFCWGVGVFSPGGSVQLRKHHNPPLNFIINTLNSNNKYSNNNNN